MQLGASKYPVNLSVRSFLSLRKFCVLAPSDITSKHANRKQNSQKLPKLETFCVFNLSFLITSDVSVWGDTKHLLGNGFIKIVQKYVRIFSNTK